MSILSTSCHYCGNELDHKTPLDCISYLVRELAEVNAAREKTIDGWVDLHEALKLCVSQRDKALAERKDSERLDWLNEHQNSEPSRRWNGYLKRNQWVWMGIGYETLRQAIDAAREGK
jgi:hypothetical protein